MFLSFVEFFDKYSFIYCMFISFRLISTQPIGQNHFDLTGPEKEEEEEEERDEFGFLVKERFVTYDIGDLLN